MSDETPPTKSRSFESQATKRVSFVLTTRNKARFIDEALRRAIALVGGNDELIVIDGASTDGTAEIVASYGDQIDVFISEPDASCDHAINKGMLVAKGEYFKHLTDDDEFGPNAMEQAISVLQANPDVDLLVCGGMRQAADHIYPFYVTPDVNYGTSPENVFKYGTCGVGFLIRRSSLPLMGLANSTGVATDAEFVAKAIYRGARVKFCRINLFHHPIYEHSAIMAQRSALEQDMNRIARQYCSRWFYLKYLVKTSLLRNRILGTPAIAGRNIVLAALARLGNKRAQIKLHPQEPIWDGGIS